ncbi:putative manganese efflux pump MntP [compost metagenome]
MIINGIRPDSENQDEDTSRHHGFWRLAMTGFATSIDAMAVGIGLAFMDVHIGVMALVIGLCTFSMVTAGVMLGRVVGNMVGKRAEIIGGIILIIIGATILYEHLSGAMA